MTVKVVVAHNRYSSVVPSGENAVVAEEIDALTQSGVTVVPFLRSSDELGALGGPVARARLAVSPSYASAAQRDLRALLREQRPDVLHLHNPYPLLSPWVVRTAHAHGVPVVHTLHNYRQTCVNGLLYRDNHSCTDCVGRRLKTPAVRHACYRGSRAQSAAMAAALTLHRSTWRSLDAVLALTPAMAEFARTLGIPDDRIVVRPNAVPDPGPHTQRGDGFLFAGRLSAEKGVALLLDAWQTHPVGSLGALRVAGDGPLAELVRGAAAARTDVTYLGRLDPPQLAAAMRAAAVVAVPSTWDDVCPTVAVHALAQGRPVLATDRGGLPWLVAGAGWAVPPTVDAFSAALPMAHEAAPGLSGAARQSYLDRFTPERAIASLLDVYGRVMRLRRNAPAAGSASA